MKTLCVLLACVAIVSSATAQLRLPSKKVQLGLIGGFIPARAIGTAPLIVNRNDLTSDFLFNGSNVEFSPAIGLTIKLNKNQFFFQGAAMYYSMRKSYAMQYIGERSGPEVEHKMSESCKSIELPLSAGVSLGRIQIKSGLSVRYEFGQSSTLAQMPGFERKMQSTMFGWHSGIGINFGKVSAELNYHQDFGNYGQGIYVNDQELLLKNSPTQLQFVVGLWF